MQDARYRLHSPDPQLYCLWCKKFQAILARCQVIDFIFQKKAPSWIRIKHLKSICCYVIDMGLAVYYACHAPYNAPLPFGRYIDASTSSCSAQGGAHIVDLDLMLPADVRSRGNILWFAAPCTSALQHLLAAAPWMASPHSQQNHSCEAGRLGCQHA